MNCYSVTDSLTESLHLLIMMKVMMMMMVVVVVMMMMRLVMRIFTVFLNGFVSSSPDPEKWEFVFIIFENWEDY